MKGIDHLVLCVNDLALARDAYGAMGFTMTPAAQHPFGTENSLVQLDGSFLELLAIGDRDAITEHGTSRFSFAAFNRDFLADGEGFSMLVLDSEDARADCRDYAADGLVTYDPFDFSRSAGLPDGREVTVGFSLAFVSHPQMQRAGFFTCQQHAPEHFWKPEYQRHDNGAQKVGEVLLLADEPTRYEGFMSAFTGSREVVRGDGELQVTTARGAVTMLSPAAWQRHFPASYEPDLGQGPRLAGYRVLVDELGKARDCLESGGINFLQDGGRLMIGPADAFGSMIILAEHL